MRRCPYCAQEIPEAAIICERCGRDLSETSWFRGRGERSDSALGSWIISLMLIVVLGGAALFAVRANAARPRRSADADNGASRDGNTLLETGEVRVQIAPGSYQLWSWTVPASRPSCVVDGLIVSNATGTLPGVFLLDDADFTGWRGGDALPGLAPSGPAMVRIDTLVSGPGVRYHLLIANRRSHTPAIVDVRDLRVVCRPD